LSLAHRPDNPECYLRTFGCNACNFVRFWINFFLDRPLCAALYCRTLDGNFKRAKTAAIFLSASSERIALLYLVNFRKIVMYPINPNRRVIFFGKIKSETLLLRTLTLEKKVGNPDSFSFFCI